MTVLLVYADTPLGVYCRFRERPGYAFISEPPLSMRGVRVWPVPRMSRVQAARWHDRGWIPALAFAPDAAPGVPWERILRGELTLHAPRLVTSTRGVADELWTAYPGAEPAPPPWGSVQVRINYRDEPELTPLGVALRYPALDYPLVESF